MIADWMAAVYLCFAATAWVVMIFGLRVGKLNNERKGHDATTETP